MAGGVILGDWTHRRRDVGGTRAVFADVAQAKPAVAWSFRPPHGGRVDQVRISGEYVYVATMRPPDPDAAGWEHAMMFALELATGRVVAERALPDPVPCAAMVVDRNMVHVVATRKQEPIFWYSLRSVDLKPLERRVVSLDRDDRREDVLDAWTMPESGLWLELESAFGGARAYAFVDGSASVTLTQTHEEDAAGADWGAPARDACSDGHALYSPLGGVSQVEGPSTAPSLWKIEPRTSAPSGSERTLLAPAKAIWARTEVIGRRGHVHAMAAEGVVYAVALAEDSGREERALAQAMAVDKSTGVVRWKTAIAHIPVRGPMGDYVRMARRPGGDVLFQPLQTDGTPCSDLVRAYPDGTIDTISFGNGRRFLLDAVLGEHVLGHHETKGGRVTVSAFEIDQPGRLLGKRSRALWTIDAPEVGSSVWTYAGINHVLVRGQRAIVAIRV